jgi:hypothetical protein
MDLGWLAPLQAEHDRQSQAARLDQLRELRDKAQALLGALSPVERLDNQEAVERAEAELMPVLARLGSLPRVADDFERVHPDHVDELVSYSDLRQAAGRVVTAGDDTEDAVISLLHVLQRQGWTKAEVD